MERVLTYKKGRSTISNTLDISNVNDPEVLQEVLLEFFNFMILAGAELPEEVLEELDNYDRSD